MRKTLLLISLISALCAATLTGCMETDTDSGAYSRAIAALESGDYETAMSEFQSAIDVDGRTAESFRGLGITCYEKGDYETALSFFESSLSELKYENQEFSEDILYYEAACCANIGDYDNAESIYLQLTGGLKPDVARALLGAIYSEEGKDSEAKEAFELVTQSEESSGYEPFLIIYEALKTRHREADAASYLEKALELTPETAKDHEMLGRIYYYLENFNKARAELNETIEMGSVDALTLMGSISLETGDIPRAREMYLSALDAGVDEALCFAGLAMCAAEEGSFETALSYIEEGLETGNTEMIETLLYNRMIIYEMMYDFSSAKAQAEELLLRFPTNEAVKTEYKYLAHA